MYKVGITGGIGSGKSLIAKVFMLLNIPVYNADSMAKQLMVTDKQLIQTLTNILGFTTYLPNGNLNKPFIAQQIFTNNNLLQQVNNAVHPVVNNHFQQWANQQQAAYVIKEAALLFEAGSYKNLDAVIGVTANEKIRLNRVMLRDEITEQQVLQRMQQQMPDSEKMAKCNFVINNNNEQLVLPQVLAVHNKILQTL